MKSSPLLAVEGLVARYGPIEAVRGIDLVVGEGEIVALIGANGAGKSTLLMAVSGVVAAAGGRILYGDADIRGRAPHRIARDGIAHVPEGRRIFPRMTVDENLAMGAVNVAADIARQERERAYQLFPVLAERHRQRAGTL